MAVHIEAVHIVAVHIVAVHIVAAQIMAAHTVVHQYLAIRIMAVHNLVVRKLQELLKLFNDHKLDKSPNYHKFGNDEILLNNRILYRIDHI